jgi:hypothetical protein
MRDENTHWQIRNSAGAQAFLDANMASAVERISQHLAAKIQDALPHNIAVRRDFQFGARNRMTIFVVAAFLRIPRVRQY